jgi:peptidoglycan/xylan/chitin deacetylase (PgdA/CDA1 family)
LPEKNKANHKGTETDSSGCDNRRRRVNRMKTAIVILVIILLILPTICCIILGLQVNRLQNKVNDLLSLHSQYGLQYSTEEGEAYAFAAEINEVTSVDKEGHNNTDPANGNQSTAFPSESSGEVQISTEVNSEESIAEPNEETEAESTSNMDSTKINSSDRNVDKAGKYADKKVYLTFDDGPSNYTDDILDILAEYQAKATFFVVGKTDNRSKELYQRIVDEGHTLGMHSYSHQYSKIYNSVEDFEKDFTKLWKLLYDTTGYKPSIFRFPGGSDNMVNQNGMEDFIRYLNDSDIVYFDWNVLNGDATGITYTKEELIENVLEGVDRKDNSIVLLHDAQTKKSTVDSLPDLLDKLISEGAQILPLDKDVIPIQMIKADTIK